jgi:hypothetical protein
MGIDSEMLRQACEGLLPYLYKQKYRACVLAFAVQEVFAMKSFTRERPSEAFYQDLSLKQQ